MKILKCKGLFYCRVPHRLIARREASILIMVLWAIFFLSGLALAINAYVRPQLQVAYRLKNQLLVETLAQAASKRFLFETLSQLPDGSSVLKDAWSVNQEQFKDVDLGTGTASLFNPNSDLSGSILKYGFVDEERKININTASLEILKIYFELSSQLDAQRSADLAQAVVNWRGTALMPNGSCVDDIYYQAQNPSYLCKNSKVEILEELLLIKGVTKTIFDKIKNNLTVYGKGAININTADAMVLESLGLPAALTGKIVHYRSGGDGVSGTADDQVFLEVSNIANDMRVAENLTEEEVAVVTNLIVIQMLGVRSDVFSGLVQAKIKNSSLNSSIKFTFDRTKAILAWQQN